MIRIGVIGLGYWGPNLVRCFRNVSDCQVTIVCDRDERRLQEMGDHYPEIDTTLSDKDVLSRDHVDAVVIATPTTTHRALALRAIDEGLHTFVEKPLAHSSSHCRELIGRAEEENVVLFVGHVFLYSTPVMKLKELVESGELGDLYYISASRLNLGPVRHDVSALWDLAPHDVSIILELMGSLPESVCCSGLAHLNDRFHDVCNLTLHFANKRMGIVHVSWLDPRKRRVMTIVGSKRMAVYDDLEPLEKIKVYDKGIDAPPYAKTFGEFQFSYRYGDTYCPHLNLVEPLQVEVNSFVESILHGGRPKTDGNNGLDVVRVIETADRSLQHGGIRVPLRRGKETRIRETIPS